MIYEFCVLSCTKLTQKKMNFFKSLQSVLYKSSYLLKYNAKVMSSSGLHEKFSIALQMVFCDKENSFSLEFLRLLSYKTSF